MNPPVVLNILHILTLILRWVWDHRLYKSHATSHGAGLNYLLPNLVDNPLIASGALLAQIPNMIRPVDESCACNTSVYIDSSSNESVIPLDGFDIAVVHYYYYPA